MPTIKLAGFSGIVPKTAKRMLPDGASQTANNVKLTSGELAPYNGAWPIASQPVKAGPFLSIYRAVDDDQSAWLSWPVDVDFVRMPFDVANEARYAWTGDGIPRYATYTQVTAGGGNDYPHESYALGLANPMTKPTVTPTGGVGAAVSRFYCYTFYNPATGEETGPSPVSDMVTAKVDSSWSLTGLDVLPANSGTVSTALKDTPTAGKVRVTTALDHWLRTGDQVTLAVASGMTDLTGTFKVTVISSKQFTVQLATTQEFTGSGTWARVVPWNTAGVVRRIYRTSGTAAAFQMVADVDSVFFTDTLLDTAIPGDDLISSEWSPPPVDLKCLRVTPSGSLVGVSGNLVCFSEPFQPHAWPTIYQFGCDFPLIGVGTAGTDVIGITTANPYLITGTEPASMMSQKLSGIFPGLSKRSIISDGNACYFATKSGLAAVQGGRVEIVTNTWFTQDEWKKYNPETMTGAYLQDRIILSYADESGNRRMLVFNFPYSQLTTLDLSAHALYVDETSGLMWVSTSDGGICEFDSESAAPLLMEQWSREYVLPKPCNFGAAKVVFETGVTQAVADAIAAQRLEAASANAAGIETGSISGAYGALAYNAQPINDSNALTVPEFPAFSTVTFTLYNGNDVVFSSVITSTGAFRLPSGFVMDRPSVKINAQGQVAYALIAETMSALREA